MPEFNPRDWEYGCERTGLDMTIYFKWWLNKENFVLIWTVMKFSDSEADPQIPMLAL